MPILPYDPARDADRRRETAGRVVSDPDLAMAQRLDLHLDLPDETARQAAPGQRTPVVETAGAELAVRATYLPAAVSTERVVVRPPHPGAVDHVMTLAVYEVPAGGAR